MVYLSRFTLPSLDTRERFINDIKRTCYTTTYPFELFPLQELPSFAFEPVTILCGGNGSGKSTILNVIAEKLGIAHGTVFNRSSFFEEYVKRCTAELLGDKRAIVDGRIITSDDVFDYLINVRCLNENIDLRREELIRMHAHSQKKPGFFFSQIHIANQTVTVIKRVKTVLRVGKAAACALLHFIGLAVIHRVFPGIFPRRQQILFFFRGLVIGKHLHSRLA